MSKKAVSLIALVVLLSAGFPVRGTSFTGHYRVTALGTLGGSWSVAYGINDSGDVVGTGALPAGSASAFLDTGAGPANPGWLAGALASRGRGVNGSGTAVGTSYTPTGPQATVWAGDGATVIGDLGGGESYGMAINDDGLVAGGATTASGAGHAFLSDGATRTDIGALWGNSWSAAYGINSTGQVTGYREAAPGRFRGFVWQEGVGAASIPALGGASSYGMAINDGGTVAGHAGVGGGAMHAFTYTGGVMADLGTLGGISSFAYGINGAGDVVGYSLTSGGDEHAFLWSDGVLNDLNGLLVNGFGWELSAAYGINTLGQIVGAGVFHGRQMGYRLDPVRPALSSFSVSEPVVDNPEPGTLFSMALGIGLVALGVWRRNRTRWRLPGDRG